MESREWLPNGLTLLQDDQYFKLGQDSMLLSHFVRIPKRARVLDLGCGTGALSLLCWRPDLQITGLELQAAPAALFARSIAENALQNVSVQVGDLREITQQFSSGAMQYVLCNPPYFPVRAGASAKQHTYAYARQDACADLDAIAKAIAWVLPTGGRCGLVFCTERLCTLLQALQARQLIPKRMQFVHQHAEKPPSVVMLECRKGSADGLQILPPFLIRDAMGGYTPAYQKIYANVPSKWER